MQFYSHERWVTLLDRTFEEIRKLGKLKGGEYSGDTDRLANFRRNGVALGLPMETVWAVYAGKHWDAIMQYIRDQREGVERQRLEPIGGRVDDLLVYLLLLKAMLEENGRPLPPGSGATGMTTLTREKIEALREAARKATPGPWGVWREPTPDRKAAIAELAGQVESTEPFAEAVWLIDANGKCPATTGCGPTSAANAEHIANCDPATILSLCDMAEAGAAASPPSPATEDVRGLVERAERAERRAEELADGLMYVTVDHTGCIYTTADEDAAIKLAKVNLAAAVKAERDNG